MATDVNKYIGIPHYFNTSSFEKCDCLGLIKLFYREHGWPQTFDDGLPIESEEDPSGWHRLIRYLNDNFNKVTDIASLQYGDVVIFSINECVHLGIYLEYGRMLAMQVPVCYGQTTSTIYRRQWWQGYFKAAYRRKED